MEGCLACSTDPLGGGKDRLDRKRRHDGAGHHGTAQDPPGNACRLREGVNLQGDAVVGCGRMAGRLDETWTCVDGRGPPSR